MKTFYYTVNTFNNGVPIQPRWAIDAENEQDAIQKLIENKIIDRNGYEFLELCSVKEALLKYIEQPKTTSARNRMGCSENWYDPLYAISQTFSKQEIEKMSEHEINNLFKLSGNISDNLY